MATTKAKAKAIDKYQYIGSSATNINKVTITYSNMLAAYPQSTINDHIPDTRQILDKHKKKYDGVWKALSKT